jgi:hypothetical protein
LAVFDRSPRPRRVTHHPHSTISPVDARLSPGPGPAGGAGLPNFFLAAVAVHRRPVLGSERALAAAATALKERERDDRDDEIVPLNPRWVRSPWTTNCSTPRSRRCWRVNAL